MAGRCPNRGEIVLMDALPLECKNLSRSMKDWILMVGRTGIEPVTP